MRMYGARKESGICAGLALFILRMCVMRFRSISYVVGFAIVCAGWCRPAVAQLSFVQANGDVGLTHVNNYGPTFDFTDTLPSTWLVPAAAMQRNMGDGAAVGDYDRDGDLDLLLLNQLGIPNSLWRNDLGPSGSTFTKVGADVLPEDTGLGKTAMFADLDNDGWQDLLLINDDETNADYPHCKIYRNNHGTFTDVTDGSGFSPEGVIKGGMCVGDYDGDGLLDVYVTFWLFYGPEGPALFSGYNRLYRNLGGFHFQDVTLDVGLGTLGRDSFTCAFADFDNDGDSDLYVAVDHSSDAYYRNDGGVFTDQTFAVGATHMGNDMGIAVADFDGDGDLDVYSTNITDPGTSGVHFGTGTYNTLLINQTVETGTLSFVDEALARGVADTGWGWGTEWLDADNDGDLDLYAVNGFDQWIASQDPFHALLHSPAVLFENDGTGSFAHTVGSDADFVGDSRAAIAFDYDRDGDQDLVVSNTNQPTILLENQTTSAGHGLDVELFGGCGVSVDGVGARIHVTAGQHSQMQEVIGGGRPFERHFGLADATSVDQLRVDWPDQTSTLVTHVPVDQHVLLYKTPGDYDFSGTIDLADFAALQRCLSEPELATAPLCNAIDVDRSGLIDEADVALLVIQLRGPADSICPK